MFRAFVVFVVVLLLAVLVMGLLGGVGPYELLLAVGVALAVAVLAHRGKPQATPANR